MHLVDLQGFLFEGLLALKMLPSILVCEAACAACTLILHKPMLSCFHSTHEPFQKMHIQQVSKRTFQQRHQQGCGLKNLSPIFAKALRSWQNHFLQNNEHQWRVEPLVEASRASFFTWPRKTLLSSITTPATRSTTSTVESGSKCILSLLTASFLGSSFMNPTVSSTFANGSCLLKMSKQWMSPGLLDSSSNWRNAVSAVLSSSAVKDSPSPIGTKSRSSCMS